jgi:putative copper export protein
MPHSSVKPSSASPSVDVGLAVARVGSTLALLAIAVWLGGLVALGALAAPVVFAIAPFPQNADAMTLVFRRFDLVAMSCGAVLLATEALRPTLRMRFAPVDHARAALSVVPAALAVYEATRVSPRIAELHAAGAVRGVGAAGVELARLHDVAEACGKAQLFLLAAVVALHVVALSSRRTTTPQP